MFLCGYKTSKFLDYLVGACYNKFVYNAFVYEKEDDGAVNILVIFTGGTIGSVVRNGWISGDQETNYVLLEKYREATGDKETVFETCMPYYSLSEYLSAQKLNLLGACVLEHLSSSYDGIIITHGTDTLAYTAAALSYSLGNHSVPVVLVSSDYPLEDRRANGLSNFIAAVKLIRSGEARGVFVSYRNQGETVTSIHLASRLLDYPEGTAQIHSLHHQPYGFCDESFCKNPDYVPSEQTGGLGQIPFCDFPEILVVESRPGQRYFDSLENCRAVILRPYHSGTLNTASERFRQFCQKAKEKMIPVFMIDYEQKDYESKKSYDELGVIALPPCGHIALYMKCWAAISLQENVKSFVIRPLIQEFCPFFE